MLTVLLIVAKLSFATLVEFRTHGLGNGATHSRLGLLTLVNSQDSPHRHDPGK